jgi:1,4-dihydroxy-2-naphthoate octaprenyltransferase
MTVERVALVEARAVRADSLQAWAVAVRPRTLLVAISPVLVGATLGFERTGSIDWWRRCWCWALPC